VGGGLILAPVEFVEGQPSKPITSAQQPRLAVKVVTLHLENRPVFTDAVFGALGGSVGCFDSYCHFLVVHGPKDTAPAKNVNPFLQKKIKKNA
jgi:hypothetical protein